MNKILTNTLVIVFLIFYNNAKAFSNDVGYISGKLILDDSWERKVYVSYIKTFEKENAVSNDLIISSAVIDSFGTFNIDLKNVPVQWSLLRIHIVKKGVSPNSLVIGSNDENFIFLIAKQDSKIELFNTKDLPIFLNTKVEGANHMHTFDRIKKLSNYPNSIDYDNAIIEKEFIREVVSEKLKVVADTCHNPLVSLYAIYQTDFQSDYLKNPQFYENYISKWEDENSSYFKSFRQKFPIVNNGWTKNNNVKYIILFLSVVGILLFSAFIYTKKKHLNFKKLSVQERRIFNLILSGLSNKEISAECNIELTTVKSHIGNIYSKLKVKSRKEAINLKIK